MSNPFPFWLLSPTLFIESLARSLSRKLKHKPYGDVQEQGFNIYTYQLIFKISPSQDYQDHHLG
jgi:hypothetical protein